MSWHLLADVQSKFKSITFGTASKVTTTEVNDEIAKTEAYVKGKISPFYDTSLIVSATAPIAYNIIKEICCLWTAGKVNEILRKNGVINPDPDETARQESMITRADKWLKGVMLFAVEGNVPGAISLVDVTPYAKGTSAPFTGQGTSVPYFKKDTEQW